MSKSKKSNLLAILAVFLLLTACGKDLKQGTVCKKEFSPGYSQIVPYPVWSGNTVIIVPVTQYYADEWLLTISGEVDGEEVTKTFSVSEKTYDSYEIGDCFNYEEERSGKNCP